MFQVFRNKRVVRALNENYYASFEQARQALRRYIREMVRKGKFVGNEFGLWDGISRGPARYTDMGFSIRKVA